MARRMFKCPKCDRRFAMAMHLARHTSTIHASKSRKGRPAKRKKKRRVRAKTNRRQKWDNAAGTPCPCLRQAGPRRIAGHLLSEL